MEQENNYSHLTRQIDLLNVHRLAEEITIIGAGAIGSFVALSLAKMGFNNITVWDDDVVSVENMNSQFYRFSDIGKKKVVALSDLIYDFTGIKIKTAAQRYVVGNLGKGIVISAVDSMASRKAIFSVIRQFEVQNKPEWFIDARMGGESALMYSVNVASWADMEMYPKTLYTDEEAIQERCTARATMYTVLAIASQICASVKNIVMGLEPARVLQWDIAKFDYVAYKKGAENGEIKNGLG